MTTLFLSFFFHNTSQKQIWKASNDLSNKGLYITFSARSIRALQGPVVFNDGTIII